MRAVPPAVLAALVLTAGAAPAAASDHSVHQSRHLWATVNVCDTERHPDTIGIRASMPGSGHRGERMFMRFQAQYYRAEDRRWHNLRGGDSGFVAVGSALFKARQAGRVFELAPVEGRRWLLRGAVTFEWRRGERVVLRARKRTAAGHHSATGSDPRGYSAATCVIG